MIDLKLVKESESVELKLVENSKGGTKNYNELDNKPTINGKTLQGNLTLDDLGIIVNAVKDILINGASIIDKNGNANIPIANTSSFGVSKFAGTYAIDNWRNNKVYQNTYAIGITEFDYAVKQGMCDGKGQTWTSEEKASARDRLGIDEWELFAESTLEQDVGYWYAIDEESLNKLKECKRIRVEWTTNGIDGASAQVWIFSKKTSVTIPANQQSTIIVDLEKEPSGEMYTGTVVVYNSTYIYAGYSSGAYLRFLPQNMRFDHGGGDTERVRVGNNIKFWGCK